MKNEALERILREVFGSFEDGMDMVKTIDGYIWKLKY